MALSSYQGVRLASFTLACIAWSASSVQAAGFVFGWTPVQVQDDGTAPSIPSVLRIEVEGNRRFTDSQLIAALGQRVGEDIDPQRISTGIENLWSSFHVRSIVEQRPVDGGIELRLVVEEMAVDLEPRFVGNLGIDDNQLREWSGVPVGGELFLHEAPLIRQRLLDSYRREGYHFAEVDVVTPDAPKPGEATDAPINDVIFQVREGPQVMVDDMQVTGATSFPDTGFLFWSSSFSEVSDAELTGSRFLWILRDEFVERTLEADLIAMRQVYRDNGWFDAIVEVDRLEFNDDRDRVVIHILVDEGERYEIGELRFEGVELVDGQERPAELYYSAAELEALCVQTPGTPYTKLGVIRDQRAVTSRYGEDGYIAHSTLGNTASFRFLTPTLVYDVENHLVHVTYHLSQGKQQYIREIKLRGNVHTQDRVLRRLLTVDPGDVADLGDINSSLRRLRGTGYFSDPMNRGNHREPSFRFIETEDGDPNWKDLEFEVEEGNDLQFTFTGNFSFDTGVYGGVQVTKNNFAIGALPSSPWAMFGEIQDKRAFHGAGETLSLNIQPGTEFSQYRVHWDDPDILKRHRDRYGFSVDGLRSFRFYEPYDERRTSLSTRITKQLTADSAFWGGLGLGTVRVSDLKQSGAPSIFSPLDVPQLLANQEGTNKLGFVELGYRKRTLDSRYVPREGIELTSTASIYNESLASDFDFYKLDLRATHYGQFGDEFDSIRTGWRLSGGLGVAQGYGDTDDVPYTERFFLGGTGKNFGIRGFRNRGVGPNEETYAQGGESFARASVGYRFPVITSRTSGSIEPFEVMRGEVFLDAGILDPDPFSFDLDEVRASTGLSLSLMIFPQVPITFSFGFPLIDGEDDEKRVFNFSIGFS